MATPKKATNSKSKSKRNGPLFLHASGQWAKKIAGKTHYFGSDRREALERYYQEASKLHTQPRRGRANLTIADLANVYLHRQKGRSDRGEIRGRQVYDQTAHLGDFVRHVGKETRVRNITVGDIESYQGYLSDRGLRPQTVNNRTSTVMAMFRWALAKEEIDRGPNLAAVDRLKKERVDRPLFSPEGVETLLAHANPQMTAMILLALNAGFGNQDCSDLEWRHIDFEGERVAMARGKTGVPRSTKLWPQTIKALQALPRRGDRVFVTTRGSRYVRDKASGRHRDSVNTEFRRLAKNAGVTLHKGMGFYTLRRLCATTVARLTGDPIAVQQVLGHTTVTMGSTYIQDRNTRADLAVEAMQDHFKGLDSKSR